MLHLTKFLLEVKKDAKLLKSSNIILKLGLSATNIKDLKKFAIDNELIKQNKQEYFISQKGEEYIVNNPIASWNCKEFQLRPNLNLEYLKEDKTPSILTKAIRNYAKYILENQPLKECSLEYVIKIDLKNCEKLIIKIESEILNGKRICLANIFKKYLEKGLTRSLISVIILQILSQNLDKIAIYEKFQFQLKFDCLMFDRIMACPQNFEIQLTEMKDIYILKDISKIILNKKSDNILEITKGLYSTIKKLDKFTMNTQNLSNKTLRFRNVILNAKDPISLFERDIPKVLSGKSLNDCDREFLNNLKLSLNELKNCTDCLIKDLKKFIFDSFKSTSKENLCERFLAIREFIGENELKILLNNVIDTNVNEDLWINRIATFINKSRVPKDWSDEDFADFKVKTKELALKFFVIEATVGTSDCAISKNYHSVLNSFLNLTKQEQMILLRKVVNI